MDNFWSLPRIVPSLIKRHKSSWKIRHKMSRPILRQFKTFSVPSPSSKETQTTKVFGRTGKCLEPVPGWLQDPNRESGKRNLPWKVFSLPFWISLLFAFFKEIPARWGFFGPWYPRPNRFATVRTKAMSRFCRVFRCPFPKRKGGGGGGFSGHGRGESSELDRGVGVPKLPKVFLRPVQGQDSTWEYHEPGPPQTDSVTFSADFFWTLQTVSSSTFWLRLSAQHCLLEDGATPKLSLPHKRGAFYPLSKLRPRGEGNCETIERQKLSRSIFAPWHQSVSSGPYWVLNSVVFYYCRSFSLSVGRFPAGLSLVKIRGSHSVSEVHFALLSP